MSFAPTLKGAPEISRGHANSKFAPHFRDWAATRPDVTVLDGEGTTVAGPFDEPLSRPQVSRIVTRTHFVMSTTSRHPRWTRHLRI